jgi:hypothetical protein
VYWAVKAERQRQTALSGDGMPMLLKNTALAGVFPVVPDVMAVLNPHSPTKSGNSSTLLKERRCN